MTKLTTFVEKAKMAWECAKKIYANMAARGRSAWGEAIRQAWKFVKALVQGEVTFWKLKDGAMTTRKIEPVADMFVKDDLVRVWDSVGRKFICFHTFQIW
ncbi:MAG TPA: hypothetical protein VGE24_12690 [Emticicia sp.]